MSRLITSFFGREVFRYFASLKLAVISLFTLAAVLAVGTIIESMYGTRAAYQMIYGTAWFAGELFILGVNVLCAALWRYPWKKHQTGFVITHLGILTVLFGSLLTQRFGIDGNLSVEEGLSGKNVILQDLHLSITQDSDEKKLVVPVPEFGRAKKGKLFEVSLNDNSILQADEFVPRSFPHQQIEPSPMPGIGVPAILVRLHNSRFSIEEWLFAEEPHKPTLFELGPAVLSFQSLWSEKDEKNFLAPPSAGPKESLGSLIAELEGREYRFSIDHSLNKWLAVGSTGFEIFLDKYFNYAIVKDNELIDKSKEPLNPAIQFRLRNQAGVLEKHTVFANFPEFPTLHRSHSSTQTSSIQFKMHSGRKPKNEMGMVGKKRGELRFGQSRDGKKLLYQVINSKREVNSQGEILPGRTIETGWMDLKFEISKWYPYTTRTLIPQVIDQITDSSANYHNALHINYFPQGSKSQAINAMDFWLVEGMAQQINSTNKRLFVQLERDAIELPFEIHLERFEIGTDPGSEKAASYTSHAIVKDPSRGIESKAVVSMNEPLKYGGFTFYQASYQLREGKPPISVFSVNRDVGRPVKYGGSLLLVFGIIIMFYMNPHYFGKIFGKTKS